MALLTAGHPLCDSPSGPDQPTDWLSINKSLPLSTYVWAPRLPRYFIIRFARTSHFPYLLRRFRDNSSPSQLVSYICSSTVTSEGNNTIVLTGLIAEIWKRGDIT